MDARKTAAILSPYSSWDDSLAWSTSWESSHQSWHSWQSLSESYLTSRLPGFGDQAKWGLPENQVETHYAQIKKGALAIAWPLHMWRSSFVWHTYCCTKGAAAPNPLQDPSWSHRDRGMLTSSDHLSVVAWSFITNIDTHNYANFLPVQDYIHPRRNHCFLQHSPNILGKRLIRPVRV